MSSSPLRRSILLAFFLIPALLPGPARGARKPAPLQETPTEVLASQLLGRALLGTAAYTDLAFLSDRIGHRLSGSAALDRALTWGEEAMLRGGLVNVHREAVQVPVWVRGKESLEMLEPIARPLALLGLGGSVGTPAEGITAPVLVVSSFAELTARATEAPGKIVVYDAPFTDYGETVAYRWAGAKEAARVGAVAALVRSITPTSLSTPHTGGMGYDDGVPPIPPIPAAAITVEDAATLHRLAQQGNVPIRLHLKMEARKMGEGPSANVVGEVRGGKVPEEVVLLGCHIDSWDVGAGAQDDGAGCAIVLEATRLIASLPRAPRRTVRVVLFTNEENGLGGAKEYARAHAAEIPSHFAALEADTGSGAPLGFRVEVKDPPPPGTPPAAPTARREEKPQKDLPPSPRQTAVLARLAGLLPWLSPLAATALPLDGSGADISPLAKAGVVSLGLHQDMSGYWPIHHTAADTLDKVDPRLLNQNVAAVALAAWYLAELEGWGEATGPGGTAPAATTVPVTGK